MSAVTSTSQTLFNTFQRRDVVEHVVKKCAKAHFNKMTESDKKSLYERLPKTINVEGHQIEPKPFDELKSNDWVSEIVLSWNRVDGEFNYIPESVMQNIIYKEEDKQKLIEKYIQKEEKKQKKIQEKLEAREAAKQAKIDAKEAAKQAKREAKEAARQTKREFKEALKKEKELAREAEKEAIKQEKLKKKENVKKRKNFIKDSVKYMTDSDKRVLINDNMSYFNELGFEGTIDDIIVSIKHKHYKDLIIKTEGQLAKTSWFQEYSKTFVPNVVTTLVTGNEEVSTRRGIMKHPTTGEIILYDGEQIMN